MLVRTLIHFDLVAMLSIKKILPWLSIRSKLIIAFAGLSVVPVAFVGLHGIFSNVQMIKRIAFENLTHDVQTMREKASNFLANVDSDMRLMRNSSYMRRLVNSLDHSSREEVAHALRQANAELVGFAETKQIYYQIRMLSGEGDELFRVEQDGTTDSDHRYRVVPAAELRAGREIFYFLLVSGVSLDQIAFAPAELLDGANERVPVISFALRLAGKEGDVGILIANVFAKDLFRVMEAKLHFDTQARVALVSSDGHYLYHSEKKKDWNKLLAAREEDNLHHDYPPEIAAGILSPDEGTVAEGVDDIICYAPLFPTLANVSEEGEKSATALTFHIFESVPKDVVLGPVYSFAGTFALFLILFLVTAVGLGLVATQQFTKPIAALQAGADIIAKGNYGHRLQVETHDEIEKLGMQFNSMAQSLEEHESEIEKHRLKLEEMVQQRTRELTEEKTKLQAVLDNVPSAFVLLDKDYRIQTASAAFTAVTGFHLDDVRGKDCATIFCGDGFCRQCVSRLSMRSGQIESHIDEVTDRKGGERFIEHVAIPMRENEEINSILEIITDITKRKQFEQRLIHTERLAAAGEMSAIIAHEFRNSLTSIKMILQLQNESNRRSLTDRRSLGVALNSIYHMERVVSELLNFARPSPMEFRTENLCDVIEESLKFVKLQLNKKRIHLRKALGKKSLVMTLDAARLKEAIMNILLNAIQAIESKPTLTSKEEILVSMGRIHLRKTLREVVYAESSRDRREKDVPSRKETGSQEGEEIVLRTGTECVLISISDTGPGIPRNLVPRIFDPFFTTKTNGTGLGLPMVKQTINAHRGLVSLRSQKGRGTTFEIYLPFLKRT